MDTIILKEEEINNHADDFSTAAQYFSEAMLIPTDTLSDITANGNVQDSFSEGQRVLSMLGNNLDLEAETMKSMNQAFQEFDNMMAELYEQGMRYPTITSTSGRAKGH